MTEIKAQRFEKVEYATTRLLELVEDYKDAQTSSSRNVARRSILEQARRYARAIENLTR